MNILEALILLCVLIVISAFVSCSELALASARKIKLQVMAKDGDIRALDVLNMQQQPGSFITIVQIGLNAVAILAGIVGEAAVRPYFDSLLARFDPWGSTLASLLTFALVTGSFILIADLMPKRLAITHPEAVAVRIVRPMIFLIFLLKPFVWFFDGLANALFKILHISTVRQEQLTSEDIYAMVDAGAQAGVLKQQEHYLIENIFDMQERTVTSTMSTREYIAYFDKNDSSETVIEAMSDKPHSKFLVCDGDLERVIGYIESHTLLTLFLKEKHVRLTDKRVLRKCLFIPDTLSLYDVLETFKTSGEDFAVVINEYALVVGVVTLKDVMSIVMGELVNTEEEPQIMRRTEDTWLIDGATPLEDVMRALGIEAFPHSENYETIAGFMMYSLRKIPKRTDFLIYNGFKFEIIDTENLKIDQLLVSRHPMETEKSTR
ncbi:hemolysin family protein [Neisseria sp. ZJ106]|uniref:Polyamine export protein n=1 Tax=Neisseria lisongii TaxID=2912188 RepID=A0AAW5ATA4_9NEIS|nr:hemolysin family protein [Neisseria lisongii]MCF7521369.1 hemolysin family protein [Neisseria lisongii]MCF7530230.1 hemolysin family protein [Neisseria lisongii]WCL71894.1 hemolysin family protein [Neisseria lisongii]